jgi:DivIVA domain-containing protein
MTWLFAVLVVLALGGIAVVAAGHGGSLPTVRDDRPDVSLPDGPLDARDLRRVRFPLAVRGYRMAEVDALLSRLADQLESGDVPAADGKHDVQPGGGRGDDGAD